MKKLAGVIKNQKKWHFVIKLLEKYPFVSIFWIKQHFITNLEKNDGTNRL
jgi:hypothetical protein